MATSLEANISYGLHDIDADSVIMFDRRAANAKMFPKLRRTQLSMLCLNEEETPTAFVISIDTNPNEPMPELNDRTNNNNNNINIYADLLGGCESLGGDCDSVRSGELALRRQENVKIEINREDSTRLTVAVARELRTEVVEKKDLDVVSESNSSTTIVAPSTAILETQVTVKNSIDAHLDKIDELNRTLDDRLKRQLPQVTTTRPQLNFDVIESADTAGVTTRTKTDQEQEAHCSSKRSSSSSSDCRTCATRKEKDSDVGGGGQTKKRSVSFSQKSINAIMTNLKEFTKKNAMPKVPKTTITLVEYKENSDQFELLDPELGKSTQSNGRANGGADKSNVEIESTATKNISDTDNKPKSNGNATKEKTPTNNNKNHNENKTDNTTNTATQTPMTAAPTDGTTTPSKTEPLAMTAKLRLKVPKIQKKSKALRQTFRAKLLNFQIKRDKICKQCTKRRRVHPSKNMFDFSKDFGFKREEVNAETCIANVEEFCTCPPEKCANKIAFIEQTTHFDSTSSAEAEEEGSGGEDHLSLKEHCYSVPSLAMSVSSCRVDEAMANGVAKTPAQKRKRTKLIPYHIFAMKFASVAAFIITRNCS